MITMMVGVGWVGDCGLTIVMMGFKEKRGGASQADDGLMLTNLGWELVVQYCFIVSVARYLLALL